MCTVMVVENRATTINWLQECIKSSEVRTDTLIFCKSGTEALDYILQNNVDIAITRLQKEDNTAVELVKAMKKKLQFPIVLGYGACKEFNFLCNVMNSGVSRYLEDVFNKERMEIFLNEAYERYCVNRMKIEYIAQTANSGTELAYSGEMLKEWVDLFSKSAVNGNDKNIRHYISFIQDIIDNQKLNHSKSMILELIIIVNEKVTGEDFKADYAMLNPKECCSLMSVETVEELKAVFNDHMIRLAKNIYLLTSAGDHKSVSMIAATNYIKNNYQRDISRDDVAAAVNLNPSYFSKFFKDQMGESFVSYLRRIRIEAAIYCLEHSSDSVKEISAKVGYLDSKYFSRLFYTHTGYTPCEYRKCVVKLMA